MADKGQANASSSFYRVTGMLNPYDEIKSRLTMKDVALLYGFEPNKKGFIKCPFHGEKTASLKLYSGDKGWYCFGCGKGGDVIKFVSLLTDLSYRDACVKLDSDFNLCLFKKPTLTQRRKSQQEIKKHQLKIKQKEYSQFAYGLLLRYRRWLTKQQPNQAVEFDIAYIDRLLDRYKRDKLIDFDIWARISSLYSKHGR